jgi:alpha-glucosidase
LGLPEVADIPDSARQDPAFRRTGGKVAGRDGCRVPLPWDRDGSAYGFSRTDSADPPAPPWLPQPAGWGERSVAAQDGDPDSFLTLYRQALRIRRRHPALGTGSGRGNAMEWLNAPADALYFTRDPGFACLANLGKAPLRLPEFREVLLASGPLIPGATGLSDGSLPPDTAVWLSR